MKKLCTVFVFFAVLLLTGCISINYQAKDIMIKGVVYHLDTDIPLDNVNITIDIGGETKTFQTKHDGSFIIYENTRFKNAFIMLERENYQTLVEKIKLKDFVDPSKFKAFYLKPKKEYQEATLVHGWIDFALPLVINSTTRTTGQQFYSSAVNKDITETQELIIYSLNYSQALAKELCKEFEAIDFRLRPELEMIILEFPMDYNLEAILEEITFHPEILEAYINYPVFSAGMPVIPNDPEYQNQWNLPTLLLPYAWNLTTGNNNIRVAVIDSEVYSHLDLISNTSEGYDLTNDNKAFDETSAISHGTHVAGILGAAANNKIGIAGTMWNVDIIPIKVLKNNGRGSVDSLISGIYKAIELEVDIINLSLGINHDLAPLHNAILSAYNQGIIIVAAAGNYSNENPNLEIRYPAKYTEVIAVGATSAEHQIASYSVYDDVKLFAPGGDHGQGILSTNVQKNLLGSPTDQYSESIGTSMATPHVTGIIGLLLSAHGKVYPPDEIFNLLWQTGTIFDIDSPEKRLVNAYAAITKSYVQDTVVEFTGSSKENSYYLTDIDELRRFYYFLPPDEYLVTAHLDVDGDGILNFGDWYYEDVLNVQPNNHVDDFIIRMEIYQ